MLTLIKIEDKKMNEEDFKRIMNQKLRMLKNTYNRYQFTDDVEANYIRSLLRYKDSKYIWQAIDELGTGTQFPHIEHISDKVNEIARRNREPERKQLPPSSQDIKAAHLAAVMSLMWIHYENGFAITDVGVVSDVYKRLFPEQPFDVEKLKKELPKEKVKSWMEVQEQRAKLRAA